MSVWVYDHTTRSHIQVEAESVREYVEQLFRRNTNVCSYTGDCELYGDAQQNLSIFPLGLGAAGMTISIYEKPSIGDVRRLQSCEVEQVQRILCGPTDDGDVILEINEHKYQLPLASMLELAVTTIALKRAIQRLDEEALRCALN